MFLSVCTIMESNCSRFKWFLMLEQKHLVTIMELFCLFQNQKFEILFISIECERRKKNCINIPSPKVFVYLCEERTNLVMRFLMNFNQHLCFLHVTFIQNIISQIIFPYNDLNCWWKLKNIALAHFKQWNTMASAGTFYWCGVCVFFTGIRFSFSGSLEFSCRSQKWQHTYKKSNDNLQMEQQVERFVSIPWARVDLIATGVTQTVIVFIGRVFGENIKSFDAKFVVVVGVIVQIQRMQYPEAWSICMAVQWNRVTPGIIKCFLAQKKESRMKEKTKTKIQKVHITKKTESINSSSTVYTAFSWLNAN